MLRITNGESSRGRDEIDYGFEEIEEFMLEENIQIDQHSERSSRSPFDDDLDNDDQVDHSSDGNYVEEATESLDESSEDEFDQIVTRGRSKRHATKAKKDNKKEKPTTRTNRTTRAASVRF